MTLPEFLLARLMDDEERCVFAPVGTYKMERLDGREEKREADAQSMMDYVHRFQPEWMMDDIRAKRKIVKDCLHLENASSGVLHAHSLWVVKTLAAAYNEHPDYRPEFAP